MKKKRKVFKRVLLVLAIIFVVGLILPQNLQMPVAGANNQSYHPQSFWYGGWGTSIVHKGVDIFARKGHSVYAATPGIVLATAEHGKGGKFVVVLGLKWRMHYYAHLDQIKTSKFAIVTTKSLIGTVGNSGNAKTTPSHLHYAIATLAPYPWRIDSAPLGWQKMFYLNPIDYLKK